MRMAWRGQGHLYTGIGGGLLYGLLARFAFQWSPPEWMRLVTIGFLFLAPIGIGALTVWLSMRRRRNVGWSYVIFAPWIPCFVLGAVLVVFALDLWICVAMALPVYMLMSSLGGILVKALRSDGPTVTETPMMGVLLLMPFLVTPFTSQMVKTEMRTVQAQVMVQADAEKVWNQIIAVPSIQPEEEQFAWFVAFGLPRPLEAELTEEGLDGVRLASYENGIRVVEPVETWEPYARYGFGADVEPESIPSPIWWEVQSEYFDVEQVTFDLEPTEGGVILHLTTSYRLTTQLNGYAAWWVDFLLGDFEHYILEIVKGRAEAAPL